MSVLTLVQRALPFFFPKRRPSSNKGKGRDPNPEKTVVLDLKEPNPVFGKRNVESVSTPHCDVSNDVHIAVYQSAEHTTNYSAKHEASETDSDADSIFEDQTHQPTDTSQSSAQSLCPRVVTWASIVRSECRWTSKHEKELVMAEKQLARCQKAWSSEQELWLAYIETLSDEKESHRGFLLMRTRQQEDEQNQFRKAWKRRRSVESSMASHESKEYYPKVHRLKRVPGYGYLGPYLAASPSTPLTCRG